MFRGQLGCPGFDPQPYDLWQQPSTKTASSCQNLPTNDALHAAACALPEGLVLPGQVQDHTRKGAQTLQETRSDSEFRGHCVGLAMMLRSTPLYKYGRSASIRTQLVGSLGC